MHSYLIEVYSNLNHDLYSNSIQNLKKFTGTLNVYELNGNLIGQLVVYNGKSKNPSGKSSLAALNEVINLYCVQKNTTSKVPECTVSEHVYTVYSNYTDHYKSVTVGTYTHYTYVYTSVETVMITEPISVLCGESEDSYDIIKRISTYRDVVDVQITNELTGKAKCLNDLLDKNGDSFVKNLLANFKGTSEFDIKIVSKDKVFSDETKEEINGKTMYDRSNPLMTIEISTSRTNEHAALEGARTILHEYIHADMYRKLYTKDVTNIEVLDFKKTYEAYGNQHGAIGALYIDSMKEALKAFHRNVLTDDYNKYTNYYGTPTDAFYEALAWGGLRDSNVKAWTDLPAEKKATIEALANRVPLLSKTVPCPN